MDIASALGVSVHALVSPFGHDEDFTSSFALKVEIDRLKALADQLRDIETVRSLNHLTLLALTSR